MARKPLRSFAVCWPTERQKPDPCRSDFFELEDGNKVFYIHISPVNGKVLLLATWLKDEESAEIKASHQASRVAARCTRPAGARRSPGARRM